MLVLPLIGWVSIGEESIPIYYSIPVTIVAISLLIIRVEIKKRNEKTKSEPENS